MAHAPRRDDAAQAENVIAEETMGAAREASERLRAVAEAEENVFGFWLETGRDQLRHNMETWQNLASVRDMGGLIELQTEYVRVSLSRLAQLMAKQAEFAASLAGIAGRNA